MKTAEEKTINELYDGWVQVKIPLPFSLRWVNSYIVPEPDGTYTIIDPGLHTAEAVAGWQEAMAVRGIGWQNVGSIVLTHQHPDHYGLAGYMQEKSGAPVYMSRRAHAYALRLWGPESDFPAALRQLYVEHGMPESLMNDIEANLASFIDRVSPQPRPTYIEAGQPWTMNGRSWQLIDAPGHAFGGLMFYDEVRQWMVCGDQVLPHITPNISVVPGEEEDPLAIFLDSLEQLRAYKVSFALPGHREPFANFGQRLEELLAHHDRRLSQIRELFVDGPSSAFDICERLFGKRLRDNPHNLRFAMSETLAHLVHLALRGRLASYRRHEDAVTVFASQ